MKSFTLFTSLFMFALSVAAEPFSPRGPMDATFGKRQDCQAKCPDDTLVWCHCGGGLATCMDGVTQVSCVRWIWNYGNSQLR
ncbi:unnamed protein product [Cercospora beticola]|nr:unnamed protein product [Cercospora beticola]